MFAQQLGRETLLIRWGILQNITQKIQTFALALQVDRLGSARTQVDGYNLLQPLWLAAEKWQRHESLLYGSIFNCKHYSTNCSFRPGARARLATVVLDDGVPPKSLRQARQ